MQKIRRLIESFLKNKYFENFIIFLIVINVIIFVLQTDVNIENSIGQYLKQFENFSMIIFSIEYALRLCVLRKFRDIFSFYMVIDLLAILPFYLSFIPLNTIFLRILRLFRLFRIAKIARYTHAFENIKQAFIKRKNELIITGFIFLTAVFLASVLIYFAEHNTGVSAFSSIMSSFWWSVVTFTTVGYGDAYPITTLGKIIASFAAIFGVGLHGLVIGIISSALMEIINKRTGHEENTSNI